MIVLTGASGHLGNVLVRDLLAAGRHVRVLLRGAPSRPALAGLDAEVVAGDVLAPQSLRRAFEGAEHVVHLASLVSIGGDDTRVERVNVEGTRNVLDAARAAGVRRLLYVGSVSAHRPHADGRIDESCALLASDASGYPGSKAQATRAVLAAADGLDVVVVSPGGLAGPHDYRRSEVGALVRSWSRHRLALTVAGGYDFADVRDVATVLRRALDDGRRGQTYVIGGRYVAITEMARIVTAHLGRGRVIEVPMALARAGSRVSLRSTRTARATPVLTPDSLRILSSPVRVDWSLAARELGATARPIESTLADTVDWWLAHPQYGGAGRR